MAWENIDANKHDGLRYVLDVQGSIAAGFVKK
jgi:hypothetical protein